MSKSPILFRLEYGDYNNWKNSLDKIIVEKFNYLMQYTFWFSHLNREHWQDKYYFGFMFVGSKFKKIEEFESEELYNLFHEIRRTNLNIDWDSIGQLTLQIMYEINRIGGENEPPEMLYFQEEEEFAVLFWSVLITSDNLNYILSYPYDFSINPRESKLDLPELKEMIEFIGAFMSFIQLLNLIEYSKFGGKYKEFKRNSKSPSFESQFRDKKNAEKIKEIFEHYEYTAKGHWQGIAGNKSELLCAYYVLRPILVPGKPTTQGRIFYREFGLDESYMSNRMMTNEPDNSNKSRIEFERIFSHLIPK